MANVGFIGPPDWDDPSPAEYHALSGHGVLGHRLAATAFGWTLGEIAEFEPQLAEAASDLVTCGADVIAIVGTPFGWSGLGDDETPHDRNRRIAEVCGVPVVSAVSAVLDELESLGARRLGLATTYYDAQWRQAWSDFLRSLGHEVVSVVSLEDVGLVDGSLAATDHTYWAPTPEQIVACVRAADVDDVDAVVVTGAGARTLMLADRWRSVTSTPVTAADTALYRAVTRVLDTRGG